MCRRRLIVSSSSSSLIRFDSHLNLILLIWLLQFCCFCLFFYSCKTCHSPNLSLCVVSFSPSSPTLSHIGIAHNSGWRVRFRATHNKSGFDVIQFYNVHSSSSSASFFLCSLCVCAIIWIGKNLGLCYQFVIT